MKDGVELRATWRSALPGDERRTEAAGLRAVLSHELRAGVAAPGGAADHELTPVAAARAERRRHAGGVGRRARVGRAVGVVVQHHVDGGVGRGRGVAHRAGVGGGAGVAPHDAGGPGRRRRLAELEDSEAAGRRRARADGAEPCPAAVGARDEVGHGGVGGRVGRAVGGRGHRVGGGVGRRCVVVVHRVGRDDVARGGVHRGRGVGRGVGVVHRVAGGDVG